MVRWLVVAGAAVLVMAVWAVALVLLYASP